MGTTMAGASLGFLAGFGFSVHAVLVNDYDPVVNNRFTGGFPATPVSNVAASFVGAGHNWSGVGWDAGMVTRNIAMISPEYFVFATHHPPGGTLNFLSPTLNAVVSYSWTPVTGTTRFNLTHPGTGAAGDFSVGKLSSALNPAHGIANYPILDLPTLPAYANLPLLTYGFGDAPGGPRIGTDVIGGFANVDFSTIDGVADTFLVYHLDEGNPGNTTYEGGDSSGPLFVPWNGSLTIIGTHSAVGTVSGNPASFDNFIPVYLHQMAALGIGYDAVPEPALGALYFGIGLSGWVFVRGIRRRRAEI